MKRVVVFGGSGKVGSLVVEGLLMRGHTVTAFVHRRGAVVGTHQLRIIEGDIHDEGAVASALEDADAVISALGSWHTPTKDILSSGMTTIIPAMEQRGIARIVSLTGAEARVQGDEAGLVHRIAHLGARIAAGKILEDAETHLRLLKESGLDWTVIRSPVMTVSEDMQYQLVAKRPYPWATIPRKAVAHALIQQLNDSHHSRSAPFITR